MKKRKTVLKTTSMLIAALMLIATLVVLGTVSVSAAPSTTTIDGETYYLIGTADDLAWFANEVNENDQYKINGKLTANIDLSSICSETLGSWTPISGYQGIFDGAGFEISGLYCTGQEMGGLFGRLYDANAVVKNVTVRGYVSGTRYVGGIVGYLYSSGAKIINCVNYATISVSNASSTDDILVGGVVGYVSGAESLVEDCINYGDVIANPIDFSSDVTAGGIAGQSSTGSTIRNCANYGDISDGDATSNGWIRFGGIVGFTRGNVINCYNEGDLHQYGVKNSQELGGIAGSAYDSAKIENCFNNGSISSDANANLGAVTGELFGTINNTYWNTENTSLNASPYLGSASVVNNTSGLSATELTTGVAAYNMGEAWGQEIGVDATPVLGGMKVYYTIDPATLCTATTPTYYYANSENTERTHDANAPAENYENGFCTICGDYQPATDGDGDGYLEIGNAGQLYWFAAQVNGGNTALNAELVANITVNSNVLTASGDLNGNPEDFRAWTPIGNSNANMYRGTFQGNGYVISGLYAKGYGVGFIDDGNRVNVYNLGVLDSYFENTGYASGAIVGYMHENGTVENCFSNATIAGSSYISGGLVGNSSWNATVKNCYYFGKTVGDPFVYSGGSWYDGKCSNNYYVSSVDDGLDFTTAISADILASGELAVRLNNSTRGGSAWGQVIGTDAYPTPIADENNRVYYGYTTCDEAQTSQIYTNSPESSIIKPEHHDFVYAANGNEITKHCGECNKLMGTATITATNVKYTGLPVSAVVNGTGDYEGETFIITYTDAENNSTTTAPTNTGSYTASITVEGKTVSVDFTIEKATLKETDFTLANLNSAYNFVPQEVEVTLPVGLDDQYVSVKYYQNDDMLVSAPSYAGNYEVRIVVSGSPNHEDAVLTYTMKISPRVITVGQIEIDDVTYNGGEHKPTVIVDLGTLPFDVTEYGGVVEYSNNIDAGNATVTITGNFEIEGGSTATFKINPAKPNITVTAPLDKVMPGYVMEITGQTDAIDNFLKPTTFTVVAGEGYTTTDGKTITIADGIKIGSTITVKVTSTATKNYTASEGTLELTVGIPQVDTTKLEAAIEELKNQIDSNDTDIADIKTQITTVNGLIDALEAADVTLDGKITDAINKAKSELDSAVATLETKLGEEVEKLQNQITSNDTDIADIKTQITTVNGLIDALEAADITLDGKITDAINKAKSELDSAVATLETKLGEEVTKLQNQINANDTDIADIKTQITTINGLIDTLEAADVTLDGKITDAINKAKSELDSAKAELEKLIAGVQTNLDNTKTELDKAIADLDAAMKKGDADLSAEIANLNTALTNAKAVLEKADADNKAELVTKIETADKALDDAIKAVQTNLDNAKAELDAAISSGDTELDGKITKLNDALAAAKTALEAADKANLDALTEKIESADKTIENAIKAVQKNLDDAKSALEAKDKELETFTVIVCVISSVALLGSGAFVTWFFIDRKKRF